jgi:L-gulonolactone oxidase
MGVITLILWWMSTLHSSVLITAQSKSTSVSEAFSHFDTATTLYSSDNYLKCIFDHHIIPTSTEEVIKLVKILHSATPVVKIRATRRGFHSSAGFVCAGQRASTKKEFHADLDDGSLPPSITVLLHRLNSVIQVDANRHTLTVGAGMTLFDLLDAAEVHNMSIRAGALPIYGNLTVSGVILASAHGSGLGTISSLGDLVTKVKWVNGKGEIFVSDTATEAGAEEVKALVGGLGLLGIVTELTLQLEPRSRTVVETRNNLDDTHIVADVTKMLEEETPHVIVHWRPDDGKYRAVMWRQQQVVDDEELALPHRNPVFYPNGRIVYFNAVEKEIVESWSEDLAAWEADMMEESEISDDLNASE